MLDQRERLKLRLDLKRIDDELERRPAPPPKTYHRDAMLERLHLEIKSMPEGPTRQAMEIIYLMETQR